MHMFGKRYTQSVIKTWFFAGAVLTVVVVVLLGVVKNYLDLPTMLVNENDQCVSAWGPSGPIDCKNISKKDWGKFNVEKKYSPLPK